MGTTLVINLEDAEAEIERLRDALENVHLSIVTNGGWVTEHQARGMVLYQTKAILEGKPPRVWTEVYDE